MQRQGDKGERVAAALEHFVATKCASATGNGNEATATGAKARQRRATAASRQRRAGSGERLPRALPHLDMCAHCKCEHWQREQMHKCAERRAAVARAQRRRALRAGGRYGSPCCRTQASAKASSPAAQVQQQTMNSWKCSTSMLCVQGQDRGKRGGCARSSSCEKRAQPRGTQARGHMPWGSYLVRRWNRRASTCGCAWWHSNTWTRTWDWGGGRNDDDVENVRLEPV